MRSVFIAMALAWLTACAALQPFQPVEVDQTRAPDGYRAAEYSVSSGHGDWDTVMVHVWTSGSGWEEKTKDNPHPRAFIDVQWKISNHSKSSVQLNLAQTRLLLTGKSNRPNAIEAEPESSPLVAAGSENTVQLSFVLPNGVDPELMQSFEVTWGLTGNNQTYSQTTRFERPRSTLQPTLGIGFGIGL